MKKCPTCKRTYSDETISFCLADGSLLSASYEASREEGPSTEVMPPTTRPVVPPTQPAQAAVPTITSFPVHHDFASTKGDVARPIRNLRPMFWAIAALIAVAIILGIVLTLRHGPNDGNESVIASNPQATPSGINNLPNPSSSPSVSTSLEKKKDETLQADPVFFPADPRPQATPTASPSVDYNRIFSGRDVDQKVRVVSKPDPVYTEQARKNQITGTVVLRAVFSSSGQVTNISAVSGLPDGLTERAIAAARNIKFEPAMKDGRPVSVWTQLEYNFNLY